MKSDNGKKVDQEQVCNNCRFFRFAVAGGGMGYCIFYHQVVPGMRKACGDFDKKIGK